MPFLITFSISTHSGPAGFAFYPLYNIMSLGFQQDNFEVIVNGKLDMRLNDNLISWPNLSIKKNFKELFNRSRWPTTICTIPQESTSTMEYSWIPTSSKNLKKNILFLEKKFTLHSVFLRRELVEAPLLTCSIQSKKGNNTIGTLTKTSPC